MGFSEEDTADTPRICDACGDKDALRADCKWCTNGYQDAIQQARWSEFRKNLRKVSGTYNAMEGILAGMIEDLRTHVSDPVGADLLQQGEDLLRSWLEAEPASPERSAASQNILVFHRSTMDYLLSKRARQSDGPKKPG